MSRPNKPPSRLAELGWHFFHSHFRQTPKDHLDPTRRAKDYLIFPDAFYKPFELPVAGKSVAIVGNGIVTGHGEMIDDHEVVIRINYPYRWKRSPIDDGEKLTLWAGMAKTEVFDPLAFENPPEGFAGTDYTDAILTASSLHCISHKHVQSGFWDHIGRLDARSKLSVHWSAPVVFDEIESTPYGENAFLLSWLTNRCYLESGYGGWYGWDVLLTGVKVLLMAAISKPKALNIFGMNFYNDGYRQPWDMHQIDVNLEVFRKIIHIARENGIPTEIME